MSLDIWPSRQWRDNLFDLIPEQHLTAEDIQAFKDSGFTLSWFTDSKFILVRRWAWHLMQKAACATGDQDLIDIFIEGRCEILPDEIVYLCDALEKYEPATLAEVEDKDQLLKMLKVCVDRNLGLQLVW